MSLQVLKESDTLHAPVFLEIFEDKAGGGTIKMSVLPTTITELLAGIPVGEKSGDDFLHIVKTCEAQAAATDATAIRIKKGSLITTDDFLCNGTKAVSISAIDKTNTSYDELTVSDGFTCVVDQVLYGATSAGTDPTDLELPVTVIGLTKNRLEVGDGTTLKQNITSGVCVRGTVNETVIPFKLDEDGLIKADLTARIRFVTTT